MRNIFLRNVVNKSDLKTWRGINLQNTLPNIWRWVKTALIILIYLHDVITINLLFFSHTCVEYVSLWKDSWPGCHTKSIVIYIQVCLRVLLYPQITSLLVYLRLIFTACSILTVPHVFSGARPYVCNYCTKNFSNHSNKRKHIMQVCSLLQLLHHMICWWFSW